MIVAADGEIEADHVVRKRHHGIERGGAGMIAHARAHPCDARRFRLLDCCPRGKAHHKMPNAVVAVDERGRRLLLHHADIGTRVDTASLEAAHVDGQPDHAMGIAAAQIGFHHQGGHILGIRSGQADGFERAPHECGKRVRSYARYLRCGCRC